MTETKKTSSLDRVVSVKDVGDINTYDLTVPKNHCFFANNVLVHNSGAIEEIADKAILIHWASKTNKEADINRIKLIIAKNKGGVTGEKTINFEPQYYRFSDDETPPKVPQEQLQDLKLVMEKFDGKIIHKPVKPQRKDWE